MRIHNLTYIEKFNYYHLLNHLRLGTKILLIIQFQFEIFYNPHSLIIHNSKELNQTNSFISVVVILRFKNLEMMKFNND